MDEGGGSLGPGGFGGVRGGEGGGGRGRGMGEGLLMLSC